MKKLLVFAIALFSYFTSTAQEKDIHISLEAQGIGTTSGAVPFWLRADQFGSIPLSGGSGSLIGRIRKNYDTTKTFDWAASFEGRANLGNHSQFDLIEGFVKGKAGIFEIMAGRAKNIVGLTDSVLSTGSFSVSGNALGIPQVKLSIPEYYSIPVLGKIFAFKGSFANGYLGNINLKNGTADVHDTKAYYLENSFYGRIGMPQWRFKVQAGYNHEVLWGDEKNIFPKFNLSGSDTYWYVLTGKVYQGSKVGNHLGSLDVGAEYRFNPFTIMLYRQNFYDKGGLGSLANIKDGLNGISIVNNAAKTGDFYWKRVVLEFFYTANQAGKLDSKQTKSGAEDYYNNYEYLEGWSYKNEALGNPFITTTIDARSNLDRADRQFFVNNRVKAFHGAAQFYAFKWLFTGKLSYSQNYGTYATGSEPYRGVGGIRHPDGTFTQVNQLSAYLEGIRSISNGYNIGYDVGYDHGSLLNNSFGIVLKVSKSFL